MVLAEKLYTAAEFWGLLPELSQMFSYELIDGVIVKMPPSSKQNAYIAGKILRLLGNYIAEKKMGYVFGSDAGYDINDKNVQIPDVSYLSNERSPQFPEDNKTLPEIAVEVISPSETPRRIHQKTERYLRAGTKCVWNVYPDEQIVEVWTLATDSKLTVEALTVKDTLIDKDILPGFELPISDVFRV